MMLRLFQLLIVAAVLVAVLATGGPAWADAEVRTEYTQTRIIPEREGFAPGETTWFAVDQKVIDGWHVFWKNPGDAGLPLALDWTLPGGFEVGEILHPVPQFIPVGPLASFAHEGAPVFLVSVTAPTDAVSGETVDIIINALWQACEEICVPEETRFEFSVSILAAAEIRSETALLFARARAALPVAMDKAARFERRGGAYVLTIDNWDGAAPADAFFFPGPEGLITPAAAQTISLTDGALTVSMEPGWTDTGEAKTVDGVLAYGRADGARAGYQISAAITGSLAPPPDILVRAANTNVALLLVMAFFGGLILNAMPCVFPIIFIKAAALMQSAKEDRTIVRAHGLLFTAGVLATFIFMGGLLLALRAGGEELGWGFHLQSPPVVGLSAYVLFLVGLNLAGLFSVGENIAGAGQSLTQKRGSMGAFFTGALAVVVAAPCIGPLLSAPMGAALVQPPAIGMAIFILMGLGLAAPYLALSFSPALGRYLPKPGEWMVVLKQALSFPVFAAAAYFLWVFSRQTSDGGLATLLFGAILLALAAWLFELSKGDGRRAMVLRAASAVSAVLAIAPLTRIEAAAVTSTQASSAYGAIETEPYSDETLANYRAAGAPVFIDFTAAWCVTCQFNKMTALKNNDVVDAFKRTGTVFLVADWTVRDPEITKALQAYGVSGVPLYVYYPPGGQAQILPQTLSRKVLLKALGDADQ